MRCVEGTRTAQEIVLRVSVTLLRRYPYRALICRDPRNVRMRHTAHVTWPLLSPQTWPDHSP